MSVVSTYAAGSPLVFDEAVSGDVDANEPLVLGEGVNTITGTFGWHQSPYPLGGYTLSDVDLERFLFVVTEGTQLSQVTVTLTDGAEGNVIDSTWTIYQDDIPFFDTPEVTIDSPGEDDLLTEPIGAGMHRLFQFTFTTAPTSGRHEADYTLRFTVQALPEPGVAALLGLSSLALLQRPTPPRGSKRQASR